MKRTTLMSIRKPYPNEAKKGAEFVFERLDQYNRTHTIYVSKKNGIIKQWGAIDSVICDNVRNVTEWFIRLEEKENEN